MGREALTARGCSRIFSFIICSVSNRRIGTRSKQLRRNSGGHMFLRKSLAVAVTLIVARPVLAQYYQTDFTPDEFKARWQKVFERIGDNAVAVFQGMPKVDGFIFPRQYNNFYYLSGI